MIYISKLCQLFTKTYVEGPEVPEQKHLKQPFVSQLMVWTELAGMAGARWTAVLGSLVGPRCPTRLFSPPMRLGLLAQRIRAQADAQTDFQNTGKGFEESVDLMFARYVWAIQKERNDEYLIIYPKTHLQFGSPFCILQPVEPKRIILCVVFF